MMSLLKKLLSGVFAPISSYQTDLERFVLSKSPTSIVEIEHWTKIYDLRQKGGFYGR